jgi:hypothetical protein
MNKNQLDLFGFKEEPKEAIVKPIIERVESFKPDHEQFIQTVLKRLKTVEIKETEQVIRDWVASDWYHGLNPSYHIAAYNICLLKVLEVNDETIIQNLL